MRKTREMTTATLLIAIFMTSAFALAPVMAQDYEDYALSITGKGTAEISDEYWHSESHSVKLLLPPPIVGADMAQVVFDYGEPLNTLDSVSFWGMLENSLGGKPYYSRPRIFLEIDTNGDGEYEDGIDARVEQDRYPVWTALDTWYTDNIDNDGDINVPGDVVKNSHIKIFGDRTGLLDDWYDQHIHDRAHMYLGQLKLETYEGETKWGDLTVLRIKVGIGGWTGPYDGTVIAFIDDVKINDVTYDFEPPTISEAIEDIEEKVDHPGVANSLTSKLQNALKARDRGNFKAFENILNAFINEVEAQSGKKIDAGYAATLIEWANAWIEEPI